MKGPGMPHAPGTVPATLAATLAACGQSHVLDRWDRLDAAGRSRLIGQLALIDWNQFATLQRLATTFGDVAVPPARLYFVEIGTADSGPRIGFGG